MPIDTTPESSPDGDSYVMVEAHDNVTAADARALVAAFRPGGEYEDAALLVVVREHANLTAGARKVLTTRLTERNAKKVPIALVVESVAGRVMMTFVFRLSGASERSRVFAREAEARLWLFPALEVRRKRARVECSVDDLEQALRDNAELALGEICAHYARLSDPLEAGAFLQRVTEAMARIGLPWDFAAELLSRGGRLR